MTSAVMACMKDEAMFVVEWVAYHLVIGFDTVVVCTNNCSDGTDALLDRLAGLAPVVHIRNDDLGGLAPQRAGVLKALAHPAVQSADWLLHIDADEFLNIQHGSGHTGDLIAVVDAFDAVALTWKLFGDSDFTVWNGGLVTELQTRCKQKLADFTAMQKTMFRPALFGSGIDHMPKEPLRPDVRLCNAVGRELNPGAMHDPKTSDHRVAFGQEINRKRHMGWDGACINHYAVRSQDLFLLKNVRGDGIGSAHASRYFLHSRWHRAANRNEVEDTTILRHLPAMKAMMAQWRRDETLGELERRAVLALQDQRDTYLTPENIRAWTNWSALEPTDP